MAISPALSSAPGRPGGSSARPARRAGGAARRARAPPGRPGTTSAASAGTTYQLPSSISAASCSAPQPAYPAKIRIPASDAGRPARPACRGRPARAARPPRGSRPARRPRSRSMRHRRARPRCSTGPPRNSTSGSDDDLAPRLEHLRDRHPGRAVEDDAQGAARRRRRASARRCRRSWGRAAAGVATSSIPARTSVDRSTMTPSCQARRPRTARGGRCGRGRRVGQAARAAFSRPSRVGRSAWSVGEPSSASYDGRGGLGRRPRSGRRRRRRARRARWPRPAITARSTCSLAADFAHHLGGGRVGRLGAAAVEDGPDAGQLVGGLVPGAARRRPRRSMGWVISSRSIRPARRVCHLSWRAASRSSSSAKVSETPSTSQGSTPSRRCVGRGDHVAEHVSTTVEGRPGHGLVLSLVPARVRAGHSHTVSTYPEYGDHTDGMPAPAQ